MSETVLKKEEQVAFALRSLYKKYGYLPYKMSKFEAYDLYASNKDFLVGDGVITFTDTDGKLLALKPDVTLSIIKNGSDDGAKQKVYYNENVYRISGETKQFKELMQVGLECIGDIGVYDIYETLVLACASLAEISDDFVLDISHLGVLSGVLDEVGAGEAFNRAALRLVAEKNEHELQTLCAAYSVAQANTEKLLTLVRSYGDANAVLNALAPVCEEGKAAEAYAELKTLCGLLQKGGYADKIRLDFSVVNDMKYYNGIVFKGFIDGVFKSVLSGGRYDRLMARMKRKTGAIGFAVYLDLLEGFQRQRSAYDLDTLVLYDGNTSLEELIRAVDGAVAAGETVRADKAQGKLRVKKLVDLTTGGRK
ncbi:MAG: ATP phosphoribosyltransferase regulatory subunit [Clostridia bacterium]|nr:ATP phosphoribosyltransferase regulatory subunit [Clostridia bacterium]